jgi:hypothetical protein
MPGDSAEAVSATPRKIFINYRRGETAAEAEKLKLALHQQFHEASVFLDAQSIPSGEYWDNHLSTALKESAVVIVLMGPGWLSAIDSAGKSRLHNQDDWVRHEIETALRQSNTLVIPVVLDATKTPMKDDLPSSLCDLPRIQAFKLGTATWDEDVIKLSARIYRVGKIETRALKLDDYQPTMEAVFLRFGPFIGMGVGGTFLAAIAAAALLYWAAAGWLFILAAIINIFGGAVVGVLTAIGLYWKAGKLPEMGARENLLAELISKMYGDTDPRYLAAPGWFLIASGVCLAGLHLAPMRALLYSLGVELAVVAIVLLLGAFGVKPGKDWYP